MFLAIGCIGLFMWSQTFSHTIKFGDCAGHVVTYSLSAKYRAITGHKLFSRTSIYIWELILPLTSVKVPIPLKDKYPQIITLTLRWEGRHTKSERLTSAPLLQTSIQLFVLATIWLSSVYIYFLQCESTVQLRFPLHHATLFLRLTSRTMTHFFAAGRL